MKMKRNKNFFPALSRSIVGGVLLSIGVVASSLLPAGTAWAAGEIRGNEKLSDTTKYSNIQVTVNAPSAGYIVKRESEEVGSTPYTEATGFYAYKGNTNNAVTGNSVILNSGSNVGTVCGAQNIGTGTVGGIGEGDGNKVTVNGGTIGNNSADQIAGCYSSDATAINNSVTINSGEVVVSAVGGGMSESGVAGGTGENEGNKVEINGGTVKSIIVSGGFSQSGAATGNSVAVTGGNVTITADSYGVIGGFSKQAVAESNKVTIGGGDTQVSGNVYGGYSFQKAVNNNEVTVTGGTVKGEVYGGSSGGSTATGNKVYIKGGTVEGNSEIDGGYAKGTASNNEVEISGGEIVSSSNLDIYGGYSYYASATDNKVTISGGTVGGSNLRIYGGYSSYDSATDNKVTISGGTVGDGNKKVNITGGASDDSDDIIGNSVVITGGTVNCGAGGKIEGGFGSNTVKNNSVTITGGEVTGTIYGAYGDEDNAVVTDNMVTIMGGTVTGDVYGAYGSEAGTDVENNTVEIAGGKIIGNVYAGAGEEEGVTLSNNKVIWSGGVVNGTVYADEVDVTGLVWGNPAMTIDAPVVAKAEGIWNFYSIDYASQNATTKLKQGLSGSGSYYFYIDDNVKVNEKAASYLTVEGKADLSQATVGVGIQGAREQETVAKLTKGDKVYLVKADNLTTSAKTLTNDTTGMVYGTIAAKHKFDLAADDNYLYAIYAGKGISEQAKAVAEIQAASSILVTDAMVYGAEEGMGAATLAATEAGGSDAYVGFGTVGFGKMRTNTGSHVDTKGYNLVAGAAKQNLNKNGSLTTGIFVEYGRSNSESVCDSSDYGEIVSKGNGHYIGGGLMAKQLNKSGTYYEGSLRIGKVNSEYESDNIGDIPKHDASATYYGIHLGYGKVFNMGKDVELDVYGKYFYSHVGGRDINIDGSDFSFDATNSHLLRVGTRWTMKSKGGFRNYVGLALQNEFAGSQDGRAEDMAIDAPSQKGFSGMLELGTKRAFDSRNKSFWEVGLKGYVGRRQGVLGQVKLEWQF